MEALEALYGFAMWNLKASVALAVVAALVAVPAYLGSSMWHRVRGDRRCSRCNAWFRTRPDEDASLARCNVCRGDAAAPLADQPVHPSGA